jgi:hypothetical protein
MLHFDGDVLDVGVIVVDEWDEWEEEDQAEEDVEFEEVDGEFCAGELLFDGVFVGFYVFV